MSLSFSATQALLLVKAECLIAWLEDPASDGSVPLQDPDSIVGDDLLPMGRDVCPTLDAARLVVRARDRFEREFNAYVAERKVGHRTAHRHSAELYHSLLAQAIADFKSVLEL